jgi:ketosteroid isomerase-like protein
MTNIDGPRAATARSCYEAYLEGRRDRVAAVLTEDFTFSSPQDDHIDRKTYFERCWPEKPPFRAIDIEHLVFDGDTAMFGYRAEMLAGGSFRNVELMRFKGDRIAEITVYFGRNV